MNLLDNFKLSGDKLVSDNEKELLNLAVLFLWVILIFS